MPWFAMERKFLLNHSVPSICDILCPKRKIGFPYVFEWVACKWLNEKNRWVCKDFCYISGKLKYRNVIFYLQEIVCIYSTTYYANIYIDKFKTFAKLIQIFCDCETTLYLFSLFILNLNQPRRSKKLENHIKLTLIFPFFVLRCKHSSWITFWRCATIVCQVFKHWNCKIFRTCMFQSNIISKNSN